MNADSTGNKKQKKESAEAAAKKEMMERRETREKEKSDWHMEKEVERQNIRTKYQLPRQNVAPIPANQETVSSGKKCVIC